MSKINRLAVAALSVLAMHGAHAGTIADNYYGGNGHGYGDVIGDSKLYNIDSAVVTRVGSVLTIAISTVFSGKAKDSKLTPVGYGDLFLAKVWTPNTSTANYGSDNMTAANTTQWKYGLALTDEARVLNQATNVATLYTLSSNTASINDSNAVMTAAGVGGTFRDGQADTVKIAGATRTQKKVNGVLSDVAAGSMVLSSNMVTFSINIAGTELMDWNAFAIHWGETCQNDVIEGITSVVPEPGTLALFGLGAMGLLAMRRRKPAFAAIA